MAVDARDASSTAACAWRPSPGRGPAINRALVEAGIAVSELRPERASLEDVFLELTDDTREAGMTGSIRAELLVLRKRPSTWILLGIWTALALVFAYAVPYATFRDTRSSSRSRTSCPEAVVGNIATGFPFFGGVFALMLGVLMFGSEYGWGTLETLFTQRPPRLQVFAAKLVTLGIALVPFVLAVYAAGFAASSAIGLHGGRDLDVPSA